MTGNLEDILHGLSQLGNRFPHESS
uniref:Uncharacterized protein n=1 Tax=Megaselia scalaris TaxID=36166 RepID=T1GH00_MEGSC